MIPKETTDLYMSIQAPGSLRQKILDKSNAAQTTSRHLWKSVLSAACLVLVITASAAFLQRPAADLLFYDNAVGNSPVAIAPQSQKTRALNEETTCLEIPLAISNDAEITVSRGEVQWTEDNGNASRSFIWLIPVNDMTDEGARLAVTINEKETSYSLFADETGDWYLAKTE